MAQIHSLKEARILREAGNLLDATFAQGTPVWRRRFRSWQSNIGRDVVVELTRDLQFRVIDVLSGDLLAQGPATSIGRSAQGHARR